MSFKTNIKMRNINVDGRPKNGSAVLLYSPSLKISAVGIIVFSKNDDGTNHIDFYNRTLFAEDGTIVAGVNNVDIENFTLWTYLQDLIPKVNTDRNKEKINRSEIIDI